jgi:hypothetical protein
MKYRRSKRPTYHGRRKRTYRKTKGAKIARKM